MVRHERIKSLKRRLFYRDGWYDAELNTWFAECAFPGCTMVIWFETATLDHFPIPMRMGGKWSMTNLRLACAPCNTTDGGEAGYGSMMPPGLSKKEKKRWWREHMAGSSDGVLGMQAGVRVSGQLEVPSVQPVAPPLPPRVPVVPRDPRVEPRRQSVVQGPPGQVRALEGPLEGRHIYPWE